MGAIRSGAILAILVVSVSPAVRAQITRSGAAPNAQLMLQMQQMAAERTSLQAENAKMKKELEDLRKDRDQLKRGQQGVEQRVKVGEAALARSAAQRESTELELAQSKVKMQEVIAKFRETIQSLRDTETQYAAAKQSLTGRDQELKSCIDRNLALYHLDDEVLSHLEKEGVLSRIAQAEPFTKLKRIQLENLVDEYKSRAQDQRIVPQSRARGAGSADAESVGSHTAGPPTD